jgi:hypothetical protein
MCGHGRYLLPLLAEGLDVSGSDGSPHMLKACHERAVALGLSPDLSRQTLESLRCPRPPRLIFIPSGSFGLLIEDGAVDGALARLFGELAPGGTLLLETEVLSPRPPQLSGVWGGRWLELPGGDKLVLSWLEQYSGAANVTSTLQRFELIRDGQLQATEFEELRVRSYTREEFSSLLARAGFADIEALKPYERAAAGADDDAIVFRAQKA